MRKPANKDGQLALYWDKKEKCVGCDWGDGAGHNGTDAALLFNVFTSERLHHISPPSISLLDDLEKRGYDLTTIKFTIQKKK